jgi:DNA-binding NarL/FixJ family response regulator
MMVGSRRIRILIADDHPLLREGLATFLGDQEDMELVGQAVDGAEAVTAYKELRPDVTILDLQMPNVSGVAALKDIRDHDPEARVIVLTTYARDVQALHAVQIGARGYLLKSGLRNELGQAIRTVHDGRRYIQLDIAEAVALAAVEEAVTPRETDVLKLAAEGMGNREIARALGVSEETVKTHMRAVLEKLDANDRTHAVAIALRRGILDI